VSRICCVRILSLSVRCFFIFFLFASVFFFVLHWLLTFALPASNVRGLQVNYLDVHESVHRDTVLKLTNKMQLYRLIYYSKSALHVSGDVFVHHQEHLTVFTVSGGVHPTYCRLVSWMS
jgi:hypothetical protein